MGNYAVFCSNDKFLICTLLRIGHNSSCASYVVCILGYCNGTFRMDKELRIWMCFLCFCHICFAHSKMSWATTLDKFKCFLRNLFCYPCSEVTVRNKKILSFSSFLTIDTADADVTHTSHNVFNSEVVLI